MPLLFFADCEKIYVPALEGVRQLILGSIYGQNTDRSNRKNPLSNGEQQQQQPGNGSSSNGKHHLIGNGINGGLPATTTSNSSSSLGPVQVKEAKEAYSKAIKQGEEVGDIHAAAFAAYELGLMLCKTPEVSNRSIALFYIRMSDDLLTIGIILALFVIFNLGS